MSYEKTDVNLKSVTGAGVVFVVAAAIICVGVWGLFTHYRDQDQRRDVRRTLVQTPPPIPPEPRLQLNPSQEWRAYRESQQRILDSYDWVSKEQGRVRIPIQRAMEMLVEKVEQEKPR